MHIWRHTQVNLFLEEMASVLLTPYVLYFILPQTAPDIVAFVAANTVEVEGVGDVCSLAAFDLARHGNTKYGAPLPPQGQQAAVKAAEGGRSRQGKVEKSLLTFIATYPTWDPPVAAKAMLLAMDRWAAQSVHTPHICDDKGALVWEI